MSGEQDRISYKSPYYADLSANVERRLGLPEGLLSAIVTRGERSNADQVSEAGARTAFQIIPATRNAALEKWGVDAYLSPENAAQVAGRLLKESLERNNGELPAAVGEYIGGTDRKNWGRTTNAYIARVMTGLRQMPGSAPSAGVPTQSAAAAPPAMTGPVLARVYQAYRDGRMAPEQEATFEQAVEAGELELPRGASLKRRELAVPVAPDRLLQAYADGKLAPEKSALFEQAIRAGELQLPDGLSLSGPSAPQEGGMGDSRGIGARLAELPGAIREAVTGEQRRTLDTDTLPEWTTMPELNELSGASFRSGLGTLLASTAEIPKILQAQYPGVQVRQDEKGNLILRSSVDSKEYAIPPGLTWGDLPRVIGGLAAFTPAGRAATLPGMAAASAGTQAVVEASQAATGGEFNGREVALAGAAGAAAPIVSRTVRAGGDLLGRVMQKLGMRGGVAPNAGAATSAPADNIAGAAAAQTPGAGKATPVSADPAAAPLRETPGGPMPAAAVMPEAGAASGAATAQPSLAAAAEMTPKQLADTASQAATGLVGRRGATEKLAAEARPNPEVVAAAKRLKMELDPDHVTDNQQFRALAGLARSEAGSTAEAQGIATLERAAQAADDALAELGATRDLGNVSAKVQVSLATTRRELQEASDRLYAQVDAAIPQSTPVQAPTLRGLLEQLKRDLGGPKGLSREEARLGALLDSEDEVLTYARLARERALVGKALDNRTSPYSSMEEGSLKRLYAALAQDQLEAVTSLGGQALRDKYRLAAQTVARRKALEKRIVSAYGRDGEGSIVSALRAGLAGAARGDDTHLRKLLVTVPEGLRKEALASALLTHSGKSTSSGQFGFEAYAKLYRGLRENSPVYATIVRTLGDGSDQLLSDLYKVSNHVAKARATIHHTGKANQALLQGPETLVGRVLEAARGRIVRGAATEAATSLAVGPTGAGFMVGAMQAAAGGRKEALKAVGELLASREFRELVLQAARGESAQHAARRVARAPAMHRFARLMSNEFRRDVGSRERWLLTPLQGGREGASRGQDRQQPALPSRLQVQR